MPHRISFKHKLLLSYIIVIFIPFILVAFFLDKHLEENSILDLKNSLVNQARLIETKIPSEDVKTANINNLYLLVKDLGKRINARITIIGSQGKVLADSEQKLEDIPRMENHAGRPEVRIAFNGSIGENTRYSDTLKIDMLYVALPITEPGQIKGVIRVALPLVNVQKNLSTIRKAVVISVLFALGLAFMLGTLLAASIIKPIDRIIYASRKFAKGDFHHKIYQDSADEIGELSKTLNKMAEDIETTIKKTELQNQHLTSILQSMAESIIMVDENSCILSINSATEKIFKISQGYSLGRPFLEVIRNTDMAEIITAVLQKNIFISKELSLIWPVNGIFQINASPIFEKNAVTGCLLVIHDITEIRKLETIRRDFVANVSHELKTPLTSIKGFVETLLEGALDDRENNREFLRIIQDHVNRLDNLVNDLLKLSYLEAKEVVLEKHDCNIRELCDEILSGFGSQLGNKGIGVKNEIPDSLAAKADRGKLEQVLINLIDNAIKFNKDKGFVRIYAQALPDEIKIIVEDSGAGIPAKDIPRIFERFYRVDKARSRQLGGTGLGLSIVKHIVELHGGMVGVESTEGLGSKFWFTLPK